MNRTQRTQSVSLSSSNRREDDLFSRETHQPSIWGLWALQLRVQELETEVLRYKQENQRLALQLRESETTQTALREQSIRDPLTGLYNLRYLQETLDRELAKAARGYAPVSLVMIDIDHFKGFNDIYGHQAGNAVLQTLARILVYQVRTGDIACRYGGEEFVVIMSDTPSDIALLRAEQWQAYLEAQPVEGIDKIHPITFSGGIATFPYHGSTSDELIQAADWTLYTAKAAGRNKIMVSNLR
jgi:diguanylate cyclase (GGDEF)-like protein